MLKIHMKQNINCQLTSEKVQSNLNKTGVFEESFPEEGGGEI